MHAWYSDVKLIKFFIPFAYELLLQIIVGILSAVRPAEAYLGQRPYSIKFFRLSFTNFAWSILEYLDSFMILSDIYDGAFLRK